MGLYTVLSQHRLPESAVPLPQSPAQVNTGNAGECPRFPKETRKSRAACAGEMTQRTAPELLATRSVLCASSCQLK